MNFCDLGLSGGRKIQSYVSFAFATLNLAKRQKTVLCMFCICDFDPSRASKNSFMYVLFLLVDHSKARIKTVNFMLVLHFDIDPNRARKITVLCTF